MSSNGEEMSQAEKEHVIVRLRNQRAAFESDPLTRWMFEYATTAQDAVLRGDIVAMANERKKNNEEAIFFIELELEKLTGVKSQRI